MKRRDFLFGTLGASMFSGVSALAQTTASTVKLRNTATACIFINLDGAPSQLDTFDPKEGPWNPRDINLNEYGGGIVLSRLFFPTLSSLTSELCLLHSVASWELAHTRGQFYLQTGHSQNPAFASDTPNIGAVIAYERSGKGPLPAFMSFGIGSEQREGFLPGFSAPFSFSPSAGGLSNLRHDFYGAASQSIFEQNFTFLQALDAPLQTNPLSPAMASYANVLTQARALVYNNAVDPVFKFTNADEIRYGSSNLGRSLIVARNVVRSKLGTAFVSVTHSSWDLHANQFNKQAFQNIYRLTSELDRALGNLILDLRASGDLNRTLIVVMGEFGRTPGPLNSRDGRDHYRGVMPVLLAGGGVKGGRAIGKTDPTAAFIDDFGWKQDRPMYPEDIVATIYSALGIDWTKSLEGALSGRRFSYITGADQGLFMPIEEAFA
jgi:uncharacterized protein (DUF1501 family)